MAWPLWCVGVGLLLPAAANSIFYVSSSRGDDAAAGTSPATPWRTLERAAAAAPGLLGGSSLLLRRGDTWVQRTAWFLTGMQGSAAAPITISEYADASSPLGRPRITRTAPAAGPSITVDNSSGVAVIGLEIVGGETGVAFTFDTRGGVPTTYESFAVTDCVFNQITGLHYNASSGSWWAPAVAFAAAHGGVHVHGVAITHNVFNGSDVMYQNAVPFTGWTRAYVSGLRVDANAALAMSYNTLFLDSTSDVDVTRNVFLRNTPAQLFVAGTTDIIMGTLNASVRILGNEISARGEYQPGGPDVDFETNATGVEFSDNYVSRSFGAGIMVFGHVSGSNTQLRIANNRLLYNGCLQARGDHGGIAFMRPGSSGTLQGNVLATCPGTPLFYDVNDPGMPGWTLLDNAIDGVDGVALAVVATPVVATAATPAGGLLVTATCATPGAVMRYTLDSALPTAASPTFPPAGLELAPAWRALAVFVKAFPPPPAGTTGAPGVVTVPVESAVAGGYYAPSP